MNFTVNELYLIVGALRFERTNLLNSKTIAKGSYKEEVLLKITSIDNLLNKFDKPIKKDQQG